MSWTCVGHDLSRMGRMGISWLELKAQRPVDLWIQWYLVRGIMPFYGISSSFEQCSSLFIPFCNHLENQMTDFQTGKLVDRSDVLLETAMTNVGAVKLLLSHSEDFTKTPDQCGGVTGATRSACSEISGVIHQFVFSSGTGYQWIRLDYFWAPKNAPSFGQDAHRCLIVRQLITPGKGRPICRWSPLGCRNSWFSNDFPCFFWNHLRWGQTWMALEFWSWCALKPGCWGFGAWYLGCDF